MKYIKLALTKDEKDFYHLFQIPQSDFAHGDPKQGDFIIDGGKQFEILRINSYHLPYDKEHFEFMLSATGCVLPIERVKHFLQRRELEYSEEYDYDFEKGEDDGDIRTDSEG